MEFKFPDAAKERALFFNNETEKNIILGENKTTLALVLRAAKVSSIFRPCLYVCVYRNTERKIHDPTSKFGVHAKEPGWYTSE